MIKRILLALDGTPYNAAATRHAIELAMAHDAELTAAIVIDPRVGAPAVGPIISAGQAARMMRERAVDPIDRIARAAERFADECRRHGVRHRIAPAPDQPGGDADPLAALVDQWRYHDLVVFGLRGLYDYQPFPEPHHVITRLVRAGVRPILATATDFRPVRRAVVAYDGSSASAKAMKVYTQMRPWPGAHTQIAVFEPDPGAARRLLDDAASYAEAHGITVATHHQPGSIRHDLLPFARASDADLIVLGDGFDASLAAVLLDDTFSHVLRNADRPILCTH